MERGLSDTEDFLRTNEARLLTLFEHSPISIWEEDFSAIAARFEVLRSEGVRNLRSYLEGHAGSVAELASLVRIVDVNQTSVAFFNARDKAEIMRGLPEYFVDESLIFFM
ncbi:MAG: hypothetical protein WCL50_01105 [Spirochaetota bacterium]